jgi:hypothetical protein
MLERQFQRKLYRAWTTNLIQGTETARISSRTQSPAEHICRSSECGRRRSELVGGLEIDPCLKVRSGWVAKVYVVEHVESLGAKLQFDAFRQIELPSQRKIHLPERKTSERIAREISVLTGGWNTKRSEVYFASAGNIRTLDVERHISI